MEDWSRAKLCDVVTLVLGTILFFSPWLFSLSAGAPRQITSTMGLFIAVLSVAALAAFAVGGMAQLDSWTVAGCSTMAIGLRG